MTNLDAHPQETVAQPPGSCLRELQVIQPRRVPLGGLRAMTVLRTLPHRRLPTIGAWCFLDQFGPDAEQPMRVLPHPHTGLQTVTWPLEGTILHRDSLGRGGRGSTGLRSAPGPLRSCSGPNGGHVTWGNARLRPDRVFHPHRRMVCRPERPVIVMTQPSQSTERLDLRRLRVLLRQRSRQGARRVRAAALPVLIAAVAAGLSWTVAHHGLGHSQPFFAPVAAWVCLGFNPDRQVRKVAELAIGVSVGVAFGELVASLVGTGALQIILVIVTATLLARFVDRGDMLTVQAGVQGTVIVALPAISYSDGASGRWADALVGGAFALVVAVLTPRDARRRARQLARGSCADLAQLLRKLNGGLATGSEQPIRDALIEARGTQGVLDEWSSVVRNARQSMRISPTSRQFLPELADLQHASMMLDRAMRNARVITRRAVTAVEQGPADDQIVAQIAAIAQGAQSLGDALGAGTSTVSARDQLTEAAHELSPQDFDEAGWRMQTLVIIMRSLVVDLLQATGLSSQSASALLAADEPNE